MKREMVKRLVAKRLLDMSNADSKKVFEKLDISYGNLKKSMDRLTDLLKNYNDEEQNRLDAIAVTEDVENLSLKLIEDLEKLPESMKKIRGVLS